jgi:hypothetical protein
MDAGEGDRAARERQHPCARGAHASTIISKPP